MNQGVNRLSSGGQLRIILVVVGLLCGAFVLFMLRGVLAPFVIAFVLAYVLSPLVDSLEARGVGRTASILCIFAAVFSSLGAMAIVAGGRVTEEIVELSDRFLRQEVTEREIVFTNPTMERVVVHLSIVGEQRAEKSFFVVKNPSGLVDLDPGGTASVLVRFAPPDTASRFAQLLLESSVAGVTPVRVELHGNMRPEVTRLRTGREDELRLGEVNVSTRSLDFGVAGPNLISSLGAAASQVQPLLQPYLGEDFDVAAMVAVWGRSLVNKRLLGSTSDLLGGVFSGLTFLVIVPFIAFFFLKEGNAIVRGIIELVPNAYFELCLNLLHQISGQIGGYIRGQLVATSVVATLAIVGLHVIGVKYAVPLGLLAGFANMIPFLGPLIGIISASTVVLATGGALGLVGQVIIIFLIIQLIDNVVVQPTVVARSVEMHPLLVLLAVMVGSQLMGIVGMLVAVPLFGIVKVSAQTVYQGVRGYRR